MPDRAVFLDRDGTINREIGYLYKAEDFVFIPGAPDAIRLLNESGYKVIVITNQAGVARGYYSELDVERLHSFINVELAKHGAHIDAFYYCPHHPTAGIGRYKADCTCRKPRPGMIHQAARDLDLDLGASFLIGDTIDDIRAGQEAGCRAILVRTGYGEKQSLAKIDISIAIADSLLDAVTMFIL